MTCLPLALVSNLRACSPVMFRLYEWFKSNPSHQLTDEDVQVASGKKSLSPEQSKLYFNNLDIQAGTLESALKKQTENEAVRNL